jgi:hypothetical protein
VIAATVAGLRYTKGDAYSIAKAIIRDLGYFGYHIHRSDESTCESIKPNN